MEMRCFGTLSAADNADPYDMELAGLWVEGPPKVYSYEQEHFVRKWGSVEELTSKVTAVMTWCSRRLIRRTRMRSSQQWMFARIEG